MDKNRMSVIWNVTRACCWNCKFCCVDAVYTGKKILNETHENELCLKDKIGVIDKFNLGNITKQSLEEILNSENALYWKNSCNTCMIFDKCKLEK